jgi:predicted phage terminase large subunit-like protein
MDDKPFIGWTPAMIAALGDAAAFEAREYFWEFRRRIRPHMKRGWWVAQLELELQRFYEELVAGKRPKLAIMAPPQHGKSWAAEDFVAWAAGHNPDLKVIFASYSDDLGMRCNASLQRRFQSRPFQRIFPNTRIGVPGWACNSSLIEFAGHTGSFRNTTIGGPINGLELHLGVLDDYVKGRAEAQSLTQRDKTWHWFADDFLSRFAERSAMLIICTRWHLDDLLGRYLLKEPGTRIFSFPAIAEEEERYRHKGEALFPKVKSLPFLLERKKLMSDASWESEYQQQPYLVGGGLIPIEKLKVISPFNTTAMVKRTVLSVDKAATADGGCFSAFVTLHDMGQEANPRWVVEDIVRGQWNAREREERLRQRAELIRASFGHHYVDFRVIVEQEPGSGGKESAETTIRNMFGFNIIAQPVTGDKVTRAEPFIAQVQGGNVGLVAGPWVQAFLHECEPYPSGKFCDQVDAVALGFNYLSLAPTLNYAEAFA